MKKPKVSEGVLTQNKITMKKPKVYKFTFYGCVHPMSANKTKADLIEEVDDAIWSCQSMTILKELEVEEYKLKLEEVSE